MKRVPCILYPLHMPEIKEGGASFLTLFHQEYNHKNGFTFITILLTVHVVNICRNISPGVRPLIPPI